MRSPEKLQRQTHYLWEGQDEYEKKQEILDEGKVGDYLEFISNNQEGWYKSKIILDNDGNKIFVTVATYDDL